MVALQKNLKDMIEKSIAIYTIIDDLLGEIEHSEPKNRKVSDSEIITTAVISALYFSGNQENIYTGQEIQSILDWS